MLGSEVTSYSTSLQWRLFEPNFSEQKLRRVCRKLSRFLPNRGIYACFGAQSCGLSCSEFLSCSEALANDTAGRAAELKPTKRGAPEVAERDAPLILVSRRLPWESPTSPELPKALECVEGSVSHSVSHWYVGCMALTHNQSSMT